MNLFATDLDSDRFRVVVEFERFGSGNGGEFSPKEKRFGCVNEVKEKSR